jgi:hypothetical protein
MNQIPAVLACFLMLFATQANAQAVPGPAPSPQAAETAPSVVGSGWWAQRKPMHKWMLIGGASSALGGTAMAFAGWSMAEGAIETRHKLQREEAWTEAESSEFTAAGESIGTGKLLNVLGSVLAGLGATAAIAGGIL